MPKLYEYLGMIVLFYSNEHTPVHVHCSYQGTECKAEIIVIEGKVKRIIYSNVKGKKALPAAKLKAFKKLIKKYSEDIIRKWIQFFVYNKPIKPQKISKL